MNATFEIIRQIARNAGFATEVTKYGVIVSLKNRNIQAFEVALVMEAADVPATVRKVAGMVVVS